MIIAVLEESADFFKEATAIVNASGPPDIEKLKVVMAKQGLVPALVSP